MSAMRGKDCIEGLINDSNEAKHVQDSCSEMLLGNRAFSGWNSAGYKLLDLEGEFLDVG